MDKVRSSAEKQELHKLCDLDCMILYGHAVMLVDMN